MKLPKKDIQRPPLSRIFSKVINKELRNLLRESIIFIVEITRQIVVESDMDK
jgi:hypothetical protein